MQGIVDGSLLDRPRENFECFHRCRVVEHEEFGDGRFGRSEHIAASLPQPLLDELAVRSRNVGASGAGVLSN